MELLLSSTGRLSRSAFLIAAAVLLLLAVVYEAAPDGRLHRLTGWIVYPALLFSAACVLSKRLHDRGRSGWWGAVFIFALVVVWPAPSGLFHVLCLLVLAAGFVELGFMRGEPGPNRFGPDPAVKA